MRDYNMFRSAVAALTMLCFVSALALPAQIQDDRVAPPGTRLTVRLTEEIGSHRSQPGDTVHAAMVEAMVADGEVIFPAGTEVLGEVQTVQKAGRMWSDGKIEFVFNRIVHEGNSYDIVANLEGHGRYAESDWKTRLLIIGLSAAGGVLVSKIFGGSVIQGLLIGAAAGTGYSLYRENDDIVLPAGTTMNLILESTVRTTYEVGEVVAEQDMPAEEPATEEPATEELRSDFQFDEEEPAGEEQPTEVQAGLVELGPRVELILDTGNEMGGVFGGINAEQEILLGLEYGELQIPLADVRELVFDSDLRISNPSQSVDSLYLKNGSLYTGTFRGIEADRFVMELEYGTLGIPINDVARLIFAR